MCYYIHSVSPSTLDSSLSYVPSSLPTVRASMPMPSEAVLHSIDIGHMTVSSQCCTWDFEAGQTEQRWSERQKSQKETKDVSAENMLAMQARAILIPELM